MAKSKKILRELLFRLKLYLFGIYFHEVKYETDFSVDYRRVHDLGQSGTIELSFSRVPCRDFILARGDLQTHDYVSFIVSATVEGKIKHRIGMLNGRRFFFNTRVNKLMIEESRIVELISDVYIDFASTVKRFEAGPA